MVNSLDHLVLMRDHSRDALEDRCELPDNSLHILHGLKRPGTHMRAERHLGYFARRRPRCDMETNWKDRATRTHYSMRVPKPFKPEAEAVVPAYQVDPLSRGK